MKKKFLKMSLICLITALCLFAISYLFFHFVTDTGIVTVKQEEAGKPFVANMIGQLSVLFFFSSIINFIIAQVFYKE